jgi:hypothetical protein
LLDLGVYELGDDMCGCIKTFAESLGLIPKILLYKNFSSSKSKKFIGATTP